MCGIKLKSAQRDKDVGDKIASNFNFSQRRNDAANNANRVLDFIKGNFSFRNKDIMLSLYNSLIKSHLEYAVQFWSPHLAEEITELENVQHTATKMVSCLCNKPYEEKTLAS